MNEEAVTFGANNSLVGVVTRPVEASAGGLGVILLNAGVLHRIGPGRSYVKIARELGLVGFTTLRFDFSGIGDSKPRQDNLPFEKSSIDETQSAMSLLETKFGIARFLLMGNCSGAKASFAAGCSDARVAGCLLINFQLAPDDDPRSNTRKDEQYYLKFAVRDPESWRKFFTGRANYGKVLAALVSGVRDRLIPRSSVPEPAHWSTFRSGLKTLIDRNIRPIFVYSESDPALDEIRQAGGPNLADLCSRKQAAIVVIPRSDHTFSSLADQANLIGAIRDQALEFVRSAGPKQLEPLRSVSGAEPRTRSRPIHVQ